MPEIEPGAGVVGGQSQTTSKIVDGCCVFADLLMRLADAPQRAGGVGCKFKCFREGGLGAGAVAQRQADITQLNRQFRHCRCHLETATKRLDRLVMALERIQQAAEFVECRRKRWLPPGGPLEPRQRIFVPADLAECQRKLRIDLRIMLAAGCCVEHRNRVGGTALHQQGMTEDAQRLGMAWFGLEDLAGNAFGVLGPLIIEGKYRALERGLAAACAAAERTRFCEFACHIHPARPPRAFASR